MADLILKRGDTAPAFRARCTDGSSPVNLSTAKSVRFLMKERNAVVLSGPMVIENQSTTPGWVHRNWGSADLATAGDYRVEVEVTWGDDTIQTFPADGHAEVQVTADLG